MLPLKECEFEKPVKVIDPYTDLCGDFSEVITCKYNVIPRQFHKDHVGEIGAKGSQEVSN